MLCLPYLFSGFWRNIAGWRAFWILPLQSASVSYDELRIGSGSCNQALSVTGATFRRLL